MISPLLRSLFAVRCSHQSLDEFRSTLRDRWEVRVGLEEAEKEAAKAAKLKERDSKKEVRCGVVRCGAVRWVIRVAYR